MYKIDILGGGAAGLAAGYFAKKSEIPFRIYEATNATGGNCRTYKYKDFRFDSGAHRFHDKDPEITREVLSLMGDEIMEVSAPSYISHNKRLVHFPITPTNLLSNLNPITSIAAIFNFLYAKFKKNEIKSFEDYAMQKYGKTISDLFLTNYSEKLWGLSTDKLSPKVAGSRLKDLNIKSILTELLFPNQKAKHLEGSFYYPRNGFGRLMNKIASHCGDENIEVDSRVTKIFHSDNRIDSFEINNSVINRTDYLVSSLPLSVFIKSLFPAPPKEILDTVEKLKFRHLKLICFCINKPQINKAATMYFPDRRFIFTRAYEPKNRCKTMARPEMTSLVLEIPYSFNDKVDMMDMNALTARTKSDLLKTGLINKEDIIATVVKEIPYAYPVLEKEYELHMDQLLRYLRQFKNLYLTGRNGKFVYSWTHNMMKFGKEIIDDIVIKEACSKNVQSASLESDPLELQLNLV